jgi:hypothetical protein
VLGAGASYTAGGHIRTQTYDYYRRHGTVTLFTALNYVDGKILSRMEARHTHVEWLRFLKRLDCETPQELNPHLIVTNYATPKHQKVKAWLVRYHCFHLHFTPTRSSWMNLVERFVADITNDVIRDGSFTSVRQLITAIEDYLALAMRVPNGTNGAHNERHPHYTPD